MNNYGFSDNQSYNNLGGNNYTQFGQSNTGGGGGGFDQYAGGSYGGGASNTGYSGGVSSSNGYNNYNQGGYGQDSNYPQSSGGGNGMSSGGNSYPDSTSNNNGNRKNTIGNRNNNNGQKQRQRNSGNDFANEELLKEFGKCFLSSISGKNPLKATDNPIVKGKMKRWMNHNYRVNPYGGGSGYGDGPRNYGGNYYHGRYAEYYDGWYEPRGYGQMMGGGRYGYGGRDNRNFRGNKSRRGGRGGQKKVKPNIPGGSQSNSNKNKKERKKLRESFLLRRKNKYLNEDEEFLVVYLKEALIGLSGEKQHDKGLLLKILLRHPNALKCLRYELKIFLDELFGSDLTEEVINKKMEALKEQKEKFLTTYKSLFTKKSQSDDFEKRATLLDDHMPILTGEKFANEHKAVPEDYINEYNKEEKDIKNFYIYNFIKAFFEGFKIKIVDAFATTKSIEKRIQFYVNNSFLAHTIITQIRPNAPDIPKALEKYVGKPDETYFSRATKSNEYFYSQMIEKNDQLSTNIKDYTKTFSGTPKNSNALQEFAECIVKFDKVGTAIKYREIYFTPHINLPAETKLNIFNSLVDQIYKDCFNLLVNDIDLEAREIQPMPVDEDSKGNPTVTETTITETK